MLATEAATGGAVAGADAGGVEGELVEAMVVDTEEYREYGLNESTLSGPPADATLGFVLFAAVLLGIDATGALLAIAVLLAGVL